jgi:hypothetical protein
MPVVNHNGLTTATGGSYALHVGFRCAAEPYKSVTREDSCATLH